jgi:hypothetical protein
MMIMKSDVLRAAAEAIANLYPCPFAGRVTAEQIKIELGERLGIWPWSIFAGCEVEEEPALADESLV